MAEVIPDQIELCECPFTPDRDRMADVAAGQLRAMASLPHRFFPADL
jgi:hypothetical protein